MFARAIETAGCFTRAIHSLGRTYGSDVIQPGAATLFFVNNEGWALTCGHVAKELIATTHLAKKREQFLTDVGALRNQKRERQLRRELEQKYGFSRSTVYEMHWRFIECIEGELDLEMKLHETLDIALLHFRRFNRLLCESFPIFAQNGGDLKPGKFLCRLGYPFAEFSNYAYEKTTDCISWTTNGRSNTPRFPLEGMITRQLIGDTGLVIGFEMSTPGLRGQSGGPAFDEEGRIWGMQFSTAHLDLDFDVDQEVLRNGNKTRARDSAFLHVGYCIHVDMLKSFMSQHGVLFQEG